MILTIIKTVIIKMMLSTNLEDNVLPVPQLHHHVAGLPVHIPCLIRMVMIVIKIKMVMMMRMRRMAMMVMRMVRMAMMMMMMKSIASFISP